MRPKIAELLEELSECTKKLVPSSQQPDEHEATQLVDIQPENG